MPVHKWSKTASNNATADSTINWAEGQAPSSVNDSARAEMAAIAEWRDDISGTLTTGGTSTAYTLTTNSVFASAADMAGAMICFIPHTTSGASPTLSVDGLTARQIRAATGVNVPPGALVQGTPYSVAYVHASTEFILIGQLAFPQQAGAPLVPAGSIISYAGASAPDGWLLCYGQAVSRTTYAALFAAIGTTYGSGDSSTTFNLPDLRGRVIAGQDDMGGTSANRLTNQAGGLDGDTLGATGGSETHTLSTAQMPSHTHTATVTDPGHTHTTEFNATLLDATDPDFSGVISGNDDDITRPTLSATTGITVSNANTGDGGSHNNVQPTIVLSYVIKT